MWQAAPLMMYEFATYSPSSESSISRCFKVKKDHHLTNKDCPDVDEEEQSDICKLLKRKNKGENMVRRALGESVQWVESMASKWCRHDPFMMRLVQCLVCHRVV